MAIDINFLREGDRLYFSYSAGRGNTTFRERVIDFHVVVSVGANEHGPFFVLKRDGRPEEKRRSTRGYVLYHPRPKRNAFDTDESYSAKVKRAAEQNALEKAKYKVRREELKKARAA